MCLLTRTDAMPEGSFSLPAKRTCPGVVLTPTSVCSACYADERKRYRWRTVKLAQDRRLARTVQPHLRTLRSGRHGRLISRRDERHFRLHDSGDFFSPPYVDAQYDVAFALPDVSFWAPTRSWAINGGVRPDDDPLLASLRRLAFLPNVTVRPARSSSTASRPSSPVCTRGLTSRPTPRAPPAPKVPQEPTVLWRLPPAGPSP